MNNNISQREQRKQERRQAIVDAAKASFLEHGYAGTSMSGLVKTLGGSKTTLWAYFRTKEELLRAVLEDLSKQNLNQLGPTLAQDDDLHEGLIRFCSWLMTALEEKETLAIWRLILFESGRFPELGEMYYDHGPRYTRKILGAFLEQHIGISLRQEDPDRMAFMLISLILGRIAQIMLHVEKADLDPIEIAAINFTDIFLRAYKIG